MILCLDIGGSRIKPALVSSRGILQPLPEVPTPQGSYDSFLASVHHIVAHHAPAAKAISLSITGVQNETTGLLTCANIPAISGQPVAADLAARIGLPVRILNDADCFALAEAEQGAGRGHNTVFAIILGSGVGGALIAGGRIVSGALGFAGEWGHGTILATEVGSPPRHLPHIACGCGRKGCVNTVGGARGLEALHQALGHGESSSHDILSRWHAGETESNDTVTTYVELVSRPLAYTLNVTGASIVVAGGGLANDQALLAALGAATKAAMLAAPAHELIVAASLGDKAGLMGAALAELADGQDHP